MLAISLITVSFIFILRDIIIIALLLFCDDIIGIFLFDAAMLRLAVLGFHYVKIIMGKLFSRFELNFVAVFCFY